MNGAAARALVRAGLCASVLACLFAAPQPAWAGFTIPPNRPGDFAPRDECAGLPGAAPFLDELRGAIGARDAGALVRLAADDVMLDFGGGAGREELRRRLSGADGGLLWQELQSLAGLGCAPGAPGGEEPGGEEPGGEELVLPWLFAQDLGDVDPYDALLATGPAVPLYTRAGARGRRAGSLNWQLVVALVDPPAPAGYTRVKVINTRREGLVRSAQVRSVIGYRLVAANHGGKWTITAIVAGD